MISDYTCQIASVTDYSRVLFRVFSNARVYSPVVIRDPNMCTRATRQGRVVALCDYCSNTVEFIGLQQAEEMVSAKGWTRGVLTDLSGGQRVAMDMVEGGKGPEAVNIRLF